MDELELLRSVRSDVPEMTPDAFEQGRAALLVRAATGPGATRRRPRRRAWRRAGWSAGGTLLGAGIATALVLTNTLGLAGWRGGADPAAAASLHAAAAQTIKESDPFVAAGKFLKVSTTGINNATATGDGASEGYLVKSSDELYVPADRTSDWIWHRTPARPYKAFTTDAQRVMEDIEAAEKRQNIDQAAELLRAPGGRFYNSPAPVSEADLQALPDNGYQLLNYIYRVTLGKGSSPDAEAFTYIADLLRSGFVPAEQRATLYDAAALIPGVTVVDKQATLDGRTGIALGHTNGKSIRQEIVIDPDTGLLIGEREIALDDSIPGLPAGTAIESTAITTTVVDSAPTGGTPCGSTPCNQ
ncbi:MAG TPA: CU044_5270 family protein [Gryllotalpicola sp.]